MIFRLDREDFIAEIEVKPSSDSTELEREDSGSTVHLRVGSD